MPHQSDQDLYNILSLATLQDTNPEFIHQYVVDAFTAQHADDHTRPIALALALAGLYLHYEKGYTGKQIQRIHVDMAEGKKLWPRFVLPKDRGSIGIRDIMKIDPGSKRNHMIEMWGLSVWHAWRENRQLVIDWLASELHIS